jgi:hypothetical protein
MEIVSVFYAAFGYLALLAAIFWGMLALLHRSARRGMLRHFARRSIPRRLERSTQAWTAAAVLIVIYVGWQPLPQILWSATGPLQWALSALFYLAWTLILIGAFLASHLDLYTITGATEAEPTAAADDGGHAQGAGKVRFTDTLLQPLYCGILIAMWVTSVMTVGHLLLATAVTAYLLFDALWAARKTGAARESRGAFSLQGERVAR